jgi:hypothetical protein
MLLMDVESAESAGGTFLRKTASACMLKLQQNNII